MKTRMKKWLVIFGAVVLIMQLSLTASAHEFSPQRYFGNLSRPVGSQAQVNFNYHLASTTSNSTYRTRAQNAISAWVSACPRISTFQFTSTIGANIVFSDSWPSSYNEYWVGAFAPSLTSATLLNYGTGWTTPTSYKTVDRINSGTIYANISEQAWWSYSPEESTKTYLHEIGHALGFNDTNDGTTSVMRQEQLSYLTPQAHDVTDFNAKYTWVSW